MKRSEMPTLPDREHDTIATLREQLASARAMVEELRGKVDELTKQLQEERSETARLERALSEKEAENG